MIIPGLTVLQILETVLIIPFEAWQWIYFKSKYFLAISTVLVNCSICFLVNSTSSSAIGKWVYIPSTFILFAEFIFKIKFSKSSG